jgi:hypothetical protein
VYSTWPSVAAVPLWYCWQVVPVGVI